MSTRAAQAVMSRRAKQELVRLLFGKKYMKRGPEAHRKLDPSIYSFAELRKAYLDRLQTIHPDKLKHQDKATTTTSSSLHGQFVELQDAWDKYEQVAKITMTAGRQPEANFTKFGVGCSFSDSPDERAMRDKITDQACRGWFSAGSLADEEESSVMTDDNEVILPHSDDDPSNEVSLCDDGLFEEQGDDDDESSVASPQHHDTIQSSRSSASSPPSLIPIGFRPKR